MKALGPAGDVWDKNVSFGNARNQDVVEDVVSKVLPLGSAAEKTWTRDEVVGKLATIFKNMSYRSSLTPEQLEEQRARTAVTNARRAVSTV